MQLRLTEMPTHLFGPMEISVRVFDPERDEYRVWNAINDSFEITGEARSRSMMGGKRDH